MRRPCIHCKSFNHASDLCPLYVKAQSYFKIQQKLPEGSFSGSAPAPFIGRYGYPHVHVGVLSPPEQSPEAWLLDAPRHWAKSNFHIPQIAEFRSSLINSRIVMNIKDSHKFLPIVQEVGMASRPVDVDVDLKEKPVFTVKVDSYHAPMGPAAELKNLAVTSNPTISTKVEKVVDDTDLLAVDAITYLHKHEFDENFLTKLLSVGAVGIEQNRKLVPTRWAITATDDMLANHLLQNVRDAAVQDSYQAFFGGYLGNYYLLLFFPDYWQYELFETYLPQRENIQYATDSEPFTGRKEYAENCAGGYYAPRLAIAEHLQLMKRQGAVLALRFITEEYTLPLGVWVTREATRKALASKPLLFSTKELLLMYARNLVKNKFGFVLDLLLQQSKLLKELHKQQRLSAYT